MCQSSIYAIDSGEQELLLEEVARVEIEGDEIILEPLFGERVSLTARIKEIDLMKHRILLERI